MKTTIYIDSNLLDKLQSASVLLNIPKNELISILLSRIIKSNSFKAKPYKAIQFQDSNPNITWKRLHIEFDPVFYEKAQDMKRNFKYSVSWFISFAIKNYLEEIEKKISDPKNKRSFKDNYHHNFVYLTRMYGEIQVFISMLGFPEEKYLKNHLI